MAEFPELPLETGGDAVDQLIADLNAAMSGGLIFERDVLDVDRPEDWGAVEMTGTVNEYADGRVIDQCFRLDIWAAVGDRDSVWLGRIEAVLKGYGERIAYALTERAYLHDVKKVLWRWHADLWSLAAPETEADGED